MENKNKEDDPKWLQALQRKNQKRLKRRRQVFIQKIVIIVLIIAAAAAAFFFVSGRVKKAGNAKPDTRNHPDTSAESFTSAEQELDTAADGAAHTEDTQTEEVSGTKDAQAEEAGGTKDTHTDKVGGTKDTHTEENGDTEDTGTDDTDRPEAEPYAGKYAWTEKTRTLGNGISSNHAVLVDIENGAVLAGKDETSRIVPASMTKVLTLLTAVEHLEAADLKDKFKITVEITDYSYVNECSCAGFGINEKVTVEDLLYGTILPSGADAALGLAIYVAGSQEDFVVMMNQKMEELGISDTAHFTNCVGIYDEDHYCTLLDMAVIMEAALENDLCWEVLSARTYTTSKTKQHKEGLLLSNWFLRRIEDKDTGGEVVCGKTGYVSESGNCAVSYGIDEKDRKYICVTADAPGSWKCIYDHVKIYKRFSKRK